MTYDKHHPKISIIVPVYQVEPYIRICLDSVLTQSFTDWELILVDDGSTDKGGIICDEYASQDSRIRVIHQKNAGLSAARNTGLDNMRGDYIAFVDSDDVLLSKDYLQILMDALTDNNAEISMCRFAAFNDGDDVPLSNLPSTATYETELTSGQALFRRQVAGIGASDLDIAYAKLYAKNVFDDVRFPVGRYIEDAAVAPLVLYTSKTVAIVHTPIYGYRIRKTGILRSGNRIKLYVDSVAALEFQVNHFLSCGDKIAAAAARRRLINMQAGYYIQFATEGILESIPADIRPDISVIASYPHRQILYDAIKSIETADAAAFREFFHSVETRRAVMMLRLAFAAAHPKELPPWDEIASHFSAMTGMAEEVDKEFQLSVIKWMAEEAGLSYLICQALSGYGNLSDSQRHEYTAHQNKIIRESLRTLKEREIIIEFLTEKGVTALPCTHHIISGLYEQPWQRRFPYYEILIPQTTIPQAQIPRATASPASCGEASPDMPATETADAPTADIPATELSDAPKAKIKIYYTASLADGLLDSQAAFFKRLDKKISANPSPLSKPEVFALLASRFHALRKGKEQMRMTLGDLFDLVLLHQSDKNIACGEDISNLCKDSGFSETLTTLLSLCDIISGQSAFDSRLHVQESALLISILERTFAD